MNLEIFLIFSDDNIPNLGKLQIREQWKMPTSLGKTWVSASKLKVFSVFHCLFANLIMNPNICWRSPWLTICHGHMWPVVAPQIVSSLLTSIVTILFTQETRHHGKLRFYFFPFSAQPLIGLIYGCWLTVISRHFKLGKSVSFQV